MDLHVEDTWIEEDMVLLLVITTVEDILVHLDVPILVHLQHLQ